MSEIVLTQPSIVNSTIISHFINTTLLASPYYFPDDSYCFNYIELNDSSLLSGWDCPVTGEMINFLNFTSNTSSKPMAKYFLSYCLAAPQDDGCPYGWCPNSDIASPLTRTASYLINILTTLIIYYDPASLSDPFWAQLLNIYSVLISNVISVAESNLTRIHAVIATGLVGSPLNFYLFFYAVRSIWGGERMKKILRKDLCTRILSILAWTIWITLVIYILVPDTQHFSQRSCQIQYNPLIFKGFFFLPLVVLHLLFKTQDHIVTEIAGFLLFLALLPVAITILAWVVAIVRSREEIWPIWPVRQPHRVYNIWGTVVKKYPFIQFLTVVIIPTAYWIATIELGAAVSGDEIFSTSFGQASFCNAIPLIYQNIQMLPRLWKWFIDLGWVRSITCHPNPKTEMEAAPSLPLSHYSIEPYEDLRETGGRNLYDGYDQRQGSKDSNITLGGYTRPHYYTSLRINSKDSSTSTL
ncbi:hypothetical protein M422DRAFT_245142 [Sphaerobolus stellatus SS14]|nr:hypothetical protein M422DRAFT_245142 [Sphaerobolus stellatus SS14]